MDGEPRCAEHHAPNQALCPGCCVPGRYSVCTETGSVYLLDLTHPGRPTVTRMPATESGNGTLRRDGEPLRVIAAAPIVIGRPLELLLDLRGDGVLTQRVTSWVVGVTYLA